MVEKLHPLPEGIKNSDENNEEDKEESTKNKERNGKEVAMDVLQTKEQKGSERKMSNSGVSKRNLWKKTRTNAAKIVQLELLKRAKKTKRKKLQFQTRFLSMSLITALIRRMGEDNVFTLVCVSVHSPLTDRLRTQRAVCLLRSHRRSFLFDMFAHCKRSTIYTGIVLVGGKWKAGSPISVDS